MALAVFTAAPAAWAQPAAAAAVVEVGADTDCTLPDTSASAPVDAATLDGWLGRLPQCAHRPGWLATLGHLLNRAQRYGEAADVIERALLLDPALKGARVDYALALAGSGDTLSARALLADILAEPDLPSGLRSALQRQRGALEQWARGGWHTGGWAGLRVGRDSNLIGAPDLDSLTLTLGGQLVELLLDESYRRQPGSYRQAEAALTLLHVTPDGARWQGGLSLRERRSPSAPQAGSRQAEVVLEHGTVLPGGSGLRGYAGVAAAALRSGLSDYTTRSLNVGLEPRWAPGCESRLGLEAQSRDYGSNPVLSGRYTGLAYGRTCDSSPALGEARGQTMWILRLGSDRPVQQQRPGGNQQQFSLRWATSQPQARLQPGATGYWLFDTETSYQRDAKGYSPIIDSGRSRRVTRFAARLEFRRPFLAWPGTYLEPAFGVDAVSQRSNIPLFGLVNWGPYVTLRARW